MKRFLFNMASLVCLVSCQKYLDERPDKALVAPRTLQDLSAILDNDVLINTNYPSAGQLGSDDYYLSDNDWLSLTSPEAKDAYIWSPDLSIESYWQTTYQKVFSANTVLDYIDKVTYSPNEQGAYEAVKGAAYFIRGYSLFCGTQVYTLPYRPSTADKTLGMVLKLSADINEAIRRSTLQQTYEQILADLKRAAQLLPAINSPLTRPGKAAAFAILSNTYLTMQNYPMAKVYADSSLGINNQLINYNTLSATAANPFLRFGPEVLFQARIFSALPLAPARCKVDSQLYSSYHNNDLRKTILYKSNGNGTYAFKGSYDANSSGSNLFSGPAVDEMYLVKAECQARMGNTQEAIATLNDVLVKRWKAGTFVPFTASTSQDALVLILAERRKELAFRGGLRWMDLRRLNAEGVFTRSIRRIIGGREYLLPPDDLRYAFLIPVSVVELSSLVQNPR